MQLVCRSVQDFTCFGGIAAELNRGLIAGQRDADLDRVTSLCIKLEFGRLHMLRYPHSHLCSHCSFRHSINCNGGTDAQAGRCLIGKRAHVKPRAGKGGLPRLKPAL